MSTIDEIATDYRRGCTLACLALRYRVADTTIMRWLRSAGVKLRPRCYPRDWVPGTNDRILELDGAGVSGVEIARRLSVSKQHVSRVRVRAKGVV